MSRTIQTIINTLEAHNINWKMEDGNLYAEEVYTIKYGDHVQTSSQWEDVSSYTSSQLRAWLGY